MGKRLAQARILKGMTQEDMAQACGASRRAIQHMEAGLNVGLATWLQAAGHLGYLGDLVGVLQQDKPVNMDQFQAIAKGKMERRQRVHK